MTLKNKREDFTAFLGVDAGPMSVGPQASNNLQCTELQTFSNSIPILFAFQLMEI